MDIRRHQGDNQNAGDNRDNREELGTPSRRVRVTQNLTNRAIRAHALPGGKRGAQAIVRDAEVRGLGVRFTAGCRKFVLEYRTLSGTRRRLVLGEFGALTLDSARELARELLAKVARGEDPAAARTHAREAPTVADLAAGYLTKHLEPKRKATTIREFRRLIARDILPALGARRAAELSAADVARWHRKLGATAPVNANHALTVLRAIYGHAAREGQVTGPDPTRHVEKFAETRRERFLTAEEVGRLGAELAASEGREHPSALLAVRLLTLTGARRSEIVTLRWADVDFERAALILPDSKTGRKVIPLGAPALALLEAARSTRKARSPFVCWGKTIDRPFEGLGKAWGRIRLRAGLDQVRLHDLRHSYASTGAAAGLGLFIVGRILGHADTKTTQRYAHLADDPVRAATERIAGEIAAKLSGSPAGELVPFGNRRH